MWELCLIEALAALQVLTRSHACQFSTLANARNADAPWDNRPLSTDALPSILKVISTLLKNIPALMALGGGTVATVRI